MVPTVFVTRWGFYRSLSGWWAESFQQSRRGRRRIGWHERL